MAKQLIETPYDDAGFPVNAAFTANYAYTALPAAIKGAAGRLCRVVVTTATAGGTISFWDNASAASGTLLLVIPAAAAVGTMYSVDLPAVNGIFASVSGVTGGAITVGWS